MNVSIHSRLRVCLSVVVSLRDDQLFDVWKLLLRKIWHDQIRRARGMTVFLLFVVYVPCALPRNRFLRDLCSSFVFHNDSLFH